MKQGDIEVGKEYQLSRYESDSSGRRVLVKATRVADRVMSDGKVSLQGNRKDHVLVTFPDANGKSYIYGATGGELHPPEKEYTVPAREIRRPWAEYVEANRLYTEKVQAEYAQREADQVRIDAVLEKLEGHGVVAREARRESGIVITMDKLDTLEKFLETVRG